MVVVERGVAAINPGPPVQNTTSTTGGTETHKPSAPSNRHAIILYRNRNDDYIYIILIDYIYIYMYNYT